MAGNNFDSTIEVFEKLTNAYEKLQKGTKEEQGGAAVSP